MIIDYTRINNLKYDKVFLRPVKYVNDFKGAVELKGKVTKKNYSCVEPYPIEYKTETVQRKEQVQVGTKKTLFGSKPIYEERIKEEKQQVPHINNDKPGFKILGNRSNTKGVVNSRDIHLFIDEKTMMPMIQETTEVELMKYMIQLDPRYIQFFNPNILSKEESEQLVNETKASIENILKYQPEYGEPYNPEEENEFINQCIQATKTFSNNYFKALANKEKINKLSGSLEDK